MAKNRSPKQPPTPRRAARQSAPNQFPDGQTAEQTEDRFRLVVEAAPIAFVAISRDGIIQLVNSQTQKLFGYSREELIGQPVEILVPQRFRSNHPQHRTTFFADPRERLMGVGRDLTGL